MRSSKDHGRGIINRNTLPLLALLLLPLGCTGQGSAAETTTPRTQAATCVLTVPASPTDMVLDRRGNLYVSEMLSGRVYCIAPDGSAAIVADRLDAPGALCLDRDGNLLVAETGSGRIMRIAPDGGRNVLSQP